MKSDIPILLLACLSVAVLGVQRTFADDDLPRRWASPCTTVLRTILCFAAATSF